MTLYRRQWLKPSPRKRNAKRQMPVWEGLNSWEEKQKGKEKRKDIPILLRVPKSSKERYSLPKWTMQRKRLEISSRKLRYTKETFHAKRSTIKDRNGMDLTEAENINKVARIHRTTHKKILMTQITMMVWSLTESQTSWSEKSSGP